MVKCKICWIFLIVFLSLSFGWAGEKISIREVIELKKVGFGDGDILKELKKSGATFPHITQKQIDRLKKNGLGQRVLQYILSTRETKLTKPIKPTNHTKPAPPIKFSKALPPIKNGHPMYNPSSSRALEWVQKGKQLYKQKKWDQALAVFDRAISIDPNYPQAYYQRGQTYLEKKDYPKALADSNRAILLVPNYGKAFNLRGVVYYFQKKTALALIEFIQAIRISPQFHWSYYNLGYILIVKGKKEELGARYYSHFLRLSTAIKDRETLSSRLSAMDFLESHYAKKIVVMDGEIDQGQFQKASQILTELTDLLSLNYAPSWTRVEANFHQSRIYLGLHQIQKGLDSLEKAVKHGYDLFMDLQKDPLFQAISNNQRFRNIYSQIKISQRDLKEILWLKGEIQRAHHYTNMVIIGNMNRVDGSYTVVPQATMPSRSTSSVGVMAYRVILRHVLTQQKWTILRSDRSRINHQSNMAIIRNMGGGNYKGPSYYQKQLSRRIAQQQTNARRLEIQNNPFIPSGSSQLVSLPPFGAHKNPAQQNLKTYSTAYFKEGSKFFDSKDYPQAVKYLTKALKLNPNYEDVYVSLCLAYFHLKKIDRALASANKLILVNPKNYKGYWMRGHGYFQKKQYQRALTNFDQMIQANPKDEWGYNNKGATLLKLKRYDKAILSLQKCLKINSNNSYAHFNLACIYSVQGKLSLALQAFQKALEKGFDDGEDLDDSPELDNLRQTSQFTESLSYYKGAFAKSYYDKGAVALNLKNYREAIRLFTMAIFYSDDFNSSNDRGVAYFYLKDYPKALADFNRAIKLDSNNYLGYQNKGETLYKLKRYSQALPIYQKALKLFPKSADLWNDLGAVYLTLGQPEKALPCLHKALLLDISQKHSYINLGTYYSLHKKKNHSLSCLKMGLIFGYSSSEMTSIPELEWIRQTPEFKAMVKEHW